VILRQLNTSIAIVPKKEESQDKKKTLHGEYSTRISDIRDIQGVTHDHDEAGAWARAIPDDLLVLPHEFFLCLLESLLESPLRVGFKILLPLNEHWHVLFEEVRTALASVAIIDGIDWNVCVLVGELGHDRDPILVEGLDVPSVGEASVGADKGAHLLITCERQAMSVEAPEVGVPYTPNSDLVNEELVTTPLSSLLVM